MNPRPPRFSVDEIRELARELYGLDAAVGVLPSYFDQNFQLDDAGRRWVLKVAHDGEKRSDIELQNRALEHLAETDLSFEIPRVRPTLDGRDIATVPGPDGARHDVRLLTYVPGEPWAYQPRPTARRLHGLGRAVGELDRAFAGFSHPAVDRVLEWDPRHVLMLRPHLAELTDPRRRERVEHLLDRFESFVAPRLTGLRTSVIHCDVNCHNVLVGPGGGLTGIIDFADVVRTVTVAEVAVAMAYAMLGMADPVAAAREVLWGYDSVVALEPAELEVVMDLALSRLALSVTSAAHIRRLEPENTYATECEAPAWQVIDRLMDGEGGAVGSGWVSAAELL